MKKWLIAILFLAAFLRFYKLSSVPPSLSLDEVSIGYNADSILETGRDEYGTPFPLLLRAYDDWRPAFYVYLVIPFVKFFGLTSLSVRLPSVLLSIVTVYSTYLLTVRLTKKESVALVASFLLAISPWHIYISRLSHEVNLGLFADVAAAHFLLRSSLIPSALFFTLALSSYQSQKVIVPLLLIGLGFFFKRQTFFVAILVAILSLPLVKVSLAEGALIRFRATKAFSFKDPEAPKIFWSNYISHLDPRWLFTGAERENHKVPNMGLLYWWELPLILVGFPNLTMLRKQSILFLLLWLLASPLPAAITTQAPHAMRSMSVLPYLQIIAAIGFVSLWQTMKKLKILHLVTAVSVLSSLWYFATQYYVVFPRTQSDSFQYALAQSIPFVLEREQEFDHVIFSNQNSLYQSYMFFLFHGRYDPKKYLADGGTKSGGFAETHAFDKFEFRPVVWERDKELRKTLLIGNPKDFPESVAKAAQFPSLDGRVGVVAVTL